MWQIGQLLQDLYLTLQQYLIDIILEHLQINHLHSHWVVGLVVAAFVDLAGVAFADGVEQAVGVVFYFLAGEVGAHGNSICNKYKGWCVKNYYTYHQA